MKTLRGAVAVLLGYLSVAGAFFAMDAVFGYGSGGARVGSSAILMLLVALVGGMGGGVLCAWVARHGPIRFLLILTALASLLNPLAGAAGDGWVRFGVILLTGLGVLIGGWTYILVAVMKANAARVARGAEQTPR